VAYVPRVRWILHAVVLLLALLGLGLGLAWWRVDSLAERLVERQGSAALGVPTTLGSARIRLAPAGVRLSELRIANPPGFADEHFFAMDSLAVAPDLASLWSDTVVIPRVEVDGVRMSLERHLTESNYRTILDNLSRGSAPAEPEPVGGGRRVRIDEIAVRDVTARVRVGVGPAATPPVEVRIPELRLTDVGQTGASAIAAQVTRSLVAGVLAALAKQGDLPLELAGDLRGSLRGLATAPLERVQEGRGQLERAAEGARGATEEAGRALRGLGDRFKRD
jgi:hypothetical protein